MAEKSCIYLSMLGRGDSPPNHGAEVVFETLVAPVMESFPEFDLTHYQYESEPGSINRTFVDIVLSADLVIADLTELQPSGFYELGIRHAAQLPTVLLTQTDRLAPFSHKDFRFVVYEYRTRDDELEQRTREALTEAIRDLLQSGPRVPGINLPAKKISPRETRQELVARINEAADAIQSLRINSAGNIVALLQSIAADLEAVEDDKTSSAMREAGEKVLKVLSRIADQLSTVKGARIIVAGIISLVLGGAGYPGATIYGLTLAFWQGPEIFAKAIEHLGKRRK